MLKKGRTVAHVGAMVTDGTGLTQYTLIQAYNPRRPGTHSIGRSSIMSIQPARLIRPLAAAIALAGSIAFVPTAIAAPHPAALNLHLKNSNTEAAGIGTQALLDTVTTLPVMDGINLSAEQYSQLYAVVDTTREQIASVISIDQQTQFQTTLDRSGGDFDAAVKAMNLSDQQESQLNFIVQVFGFQASSILTPEQQRIISANIEGN